MYKVKKQMFGELKDITARQYHTIADALCFAVEEAGNAAAVEWPRAHARLVAVHASKSRSNIDGCEYEVSASHENKVHQLRYFIVKEA